MRPSDDHWRRTALVDSALRFVFDDNDDDPTYEKIAGNLLPIIRGRAQAAALDSDLRPVDVLGEHLAILLAVDRPHSLLITTQEMRTGWGRSDAELLRVAIENLKALPASFERAERGFYVSTCGDYYDVSRLLLPEMFTALPLKGRPVAVAISRTCVVVAGEDEPQALCAMAAFVEVAMRDEVRPISHAPLLLEEGVWRFYQPPEGGLSPLRLLVAKQQHGDYALQTEALQKRLEENGEDRFIAPLEGRFVGDELMSWTSMTRAVPTLLPRADVVVLVDEGSASLCRRWEEIETVCGPFQPADDVGYPPRYRGEFWPTDEEWTRLRSQFSPPAWMPADQGR